MRKVSLQELTRANLQLWAKSSFVTIGARKITYAFLRRHVHKNAVFIFLFTTNFKIITQELTGNRKVLQDPAWVEFRFESDSVWSTFFKPLEKS